ncbi:MAG: nitrous oxide-stimulated promoter family protein [Dehalococcoidales bacterium]|nr:nitrous oxide-stimulated promoter family protein [Dehalococcoidales bacterium]
MSKIFERLNTKKEKDIRTLADFVQIFCRENHSSATREAFPVKEERLQPILDGQTPELCPDCVKLLNHGIAKLLLCSHDPKPMCKRCKTQCYGPGYRERIREVMRFSALYLIKHGRVDLMLHYMF